MKSDFERVHLQRDFIKQDLLSIEECEICIGMIYNINKMYLKLPVRPDPTMWKLNVDKGAFGSNIY